MWHLESCDREGQCTPAGHASYRSITTAQKAARDLEKAFRAPVFAVGADGIRSRIVGDMNCAEAKRQLLR